MPDHKSQSPGEFTGFSFIDGKDLPSLDRVAIAISAAYRPELILILCKKEAVCIPGGNGKLSVVAAQLRQIADGLDQAHGAVGGLTLDQLTSTAKGRSDA